MARQRRDWLHWAFEASLVSKAVLDGIEALSGLVLLIATQGPLPALARQLTSSQVSDHPKDLISRFLRHLAETYSVEAQSFYGLYLLTHGLLKVAIVVLLAKGYRWAYPLSIAVLGVFVIWQLHRFSFNHSPVMLILSALDILIIALTLREWRMKAIETH